MFVGSGSCQVLGFRACKSSKDFPAGFRLGFLGLLPLLMRI